MEIKAGTILILVATSTLLQLYYTAHDYAWFMLHLVIAGLFVSFALTFTAIVLLIRLLKRFEDLLTKLNQLLSGNIFIGCIALIGFTYRLLSFLESDQESIKSIYTNASTSKKVTLSNILTIFYYK